MNSECGISCGFVVEKNTYFNPLDQFLVQLSKFFPLDYILFATILLYVFISSLYGLVKLGVRIICFTVHYKCLLLC